jgi:hypothetical protein
MSDNANCSSHPIVALAPGSSVHISGGELEDATVGQLLSKDREVDIERSRREASIVQPHDVYFVEKHDVNDVEKEALDTAIDEATICK